MSRTIEFREDTFVLHLSGLTSAAALKRHVEIPYTSIKTISIENFEIPLLEFRVGTSIADIREGRFLLDGKWCFVSYENHENVVVLELAEHEYWKVIFQIDNPEETKQRLLEKIKIT
jgi:hypothetical protein